MLAWLKSFWRRVPAEAQTKVTVDAETVRYAGADGRVDTVQWSELRLVAVETTDTGPFLEDVFFYLEGPEYGFHIPQAAQGTKELVDMITSLPGFNSEAFCAAMCCTDNAKFVCWRKSEAAGFEQGPSINV